MATPALLFCLFTEPPENDNVLGNPLVLERGNGNEILELQRRRGFVQYAPVVRHLLYRLLKLPKTRSSAYIAVRS